MQYLAQYFWLICLIHCITKNHNLQWKIGTECQYQSIVFGLSFFENLYMSQFLFLILALGAILRLNLSYTQICILINMAYFINAIKTYFRIGLFWKRGIHLTLFLAKYSKANFEQIMANKGLFSKPFLTFLQHHVANT